MAKTALNIILFITTCLLGFAVLIAGAHPLKTQDPAEESKSKGPLVVLKKNQADSPITITYTTVDSSPEDLKPVIRLAIINNSADRILAYTIKHESVLNHDKGIISGSIITINPDRDQALRPGESRELQVSGIDYSAPPKSVTLSVDFVELVGGTHWGPDTLNTGERLDGVKAGANAAREALTQLLMTEGSDAVIRSLDSTIAKANQTVQHSAQWLSGFKDGVGWVRERVRAKGQDFSEIEKELRYFDGLRREWR